MRSLRASWQLYCRNKLGLFGLFLLLAFAVIAIFAPFISPYDPRLFVGRPFEPPSLRHILGTNDIGQDIFSEIAYGSRISLLIGISAALVSVFIGSMVGLVSGYFGKLVDSFLMRLVDIILVLPFLPLMILLAAYLGPSFLNVILVISALIWARPARVIRSQVLSITARGYVEAARSLGGSPLHIIFSHVLPGILPLILAQLVQAANLSILIEAALSFLGLGDPLEKSWGSILYYANVRGAFLTGAWIWWVLPPGLCITAVVLGFAFTGYALEEAANPRLRR